MGTRRRAHRGADPGALDRSGGGAVLCAALRAADRLGAAAGRHLPCARLATRRAAAEAAGAGPWCRSRGHPDDHRALLAAWRAGAGPGVGRGAIRSAAGRRDDRFDVEPANVQRRIGQAPVGRSGAPDHRAARRKQARIQHQRARWAVRLPARALRIDSFSRLPLPLLRCRDSIATRKACPVNAPAFSAPPAVPASRRPVP